MLCFALGKHIKWLSYQYYANSWPTNFPMWWVVYQGIFWNSSVFFWSTKAPQHVNVKRKRGRFHFQHGWPMQKQREEFHKWKEIFVIARFVSRTDKCHPRKLHLCPLFCSLWPQKYYCSQIWHLLYPYEQLHQSEFQLFSEK